MSRGSVGKCCMDTAPRRIRRLILAWKKEILIHFDGKSITKPDYNKYE